MGALIEFQKVQTMSPRDPRYAEELKRVCELLAAELHELYEFQVKEMREKLEFQEGCE